MPKTLYVPAGRAFIASTSKTLEDLILTLAELEGTPAWGPGVARALALALALSRELAPTPRGLDCR